MSPEQNDWLDQLDADLELGELISTFLDDAQLPDDSTEDEVDETYIPDIDPQVDERGNLDSTQPTLIEE